MHCERRAASRAAWTAGKSSAIRTAMMAMTTSSSISVNPRVPQPVLHEGKLLIGFGVNNGVCSMKTSVAL